MHKARKISWNLFEDISNFFFYRFRMQKKTSLNFFKVDNLTNS